LKLPPERQQAILEAAMREFADAGFEAGRMENVAKSVGVTKGLLYYYFEDKQDLLTTIYEQVLAMLTGALRPPRGKIQPEQFWQGLEQSYERVLELIVMKPVLYAFMSRTMSEVGIGRIPPGFEAHWEATRMALKKTVKLGQSSGALRRDLPEGLMLSAVMGVVTACDRWIMGEALRGNRKKTDVKAVISLYRSAFGVSK
jgi:AcrR family transcriptional regulator